MYDYMKGCRNFELDELSIDIHNKNLLLNKMEILHFIKEGKLGKKDLECKIQNLNIEEDEKNIIKGLEVNKKKVVGILAQNHTVIELNAPVLDKLVIGFGESSVDENSLTLHHIYGIPYIPGSAIKGFLKNFMIKKYYEEEFQYKNSSDIEKEINKDVMFRTVFGGNEEKSNVQGQVIFFDAFPKDNYQLGLDIMTPHHKDYYTENDKKNPLDTDKPEPHLFYVVESGTTFRFDLAVSKSIESKVEVMKENSVCSNELKKYDDFGTFILADLIEALICHGIGAKTAVGYGYFDLDKEQELKKYKNLVEKNKKGI